MRARIARLSELVMGKIKINWLQAQQDYMSSRETSLKDISQKYGISLSRVKKVSMKQRWSEARNRIWETATQAAFEETTDSAKTLIERHTEAARYLQEAGIKELKRRIRNKQLSGIKANLFLKMILVGLKAERALYPKELVTQNRVESLEDDGFSEELIEAARESLVKYPPKSISNE